jgi:hypothetical protein
VVGWGGGGSRGQNRLVVVESPSLILCLPGYRMASTMRSADWPDQTGPEEVPPRGNSARGREKPGRDVASGFGTWVCASEPAGKVVVGGCLLEVPAKMGSNAKPMWWARWGSVPG